MWEYKMMDFAESFMACDHVGDNITDKLNEQGLDGWEVATSAWVGTVRARLVFWLKRRKIAFSLKLAADGVHLEANEVEQDIISVMQRLRKNGLSL